jgi:hypothetical protein
MSTNTSFDRALIASRRTLTDAKYALRDVAEWRKVLALLKRQAARPSEPPDQDSDD